MASVNDTRHKGENATAMTSSKSARHSSRKSSARRILKSLASLKLAVVVILAIAAITARGTFVEAELDAQAAQKLVYHSVWMVAIMILFAINLIAVMIDRWPWQKRHTGFILAHIGILLLLAGALLTQMFGVDGSMSLAPDEHVHQITVGQTDLTVYTSLDGSSYRKLFDQEVDFFLHPPTPEKPIEIAIPNGSLKLTQYYRYAFRQSKVVASDNQRAGAALRFQIANARVNVSEWLIQPGAGRTVRKDLGPAEVIFGDVDVKTVKGKNAIVLHPQKAGDVTYSIYTASHPNEIERGRVNAGDAIETGWMGLVFRVLKVLPRAQEEVTFKPNDKPTPLTLSALEVEYNGRKQWMSINTLLKLFSDQAVYIVAYANRRLDVGVDMQLREFKVGRYPGTMRAASYESVVDVADRGRETISMNQPLKMNGYTFYQSSFDQDEQGRPVASILSVNRDPGRWVKYLGALLIVAGAIHLFTMKRTAQRKEAT